MKFCTSCQFTRAEEGGMIKPGKIKRWVCKQCIDKNTDSIYRRREEPSLFVERPRARR